ncbi:BTAD domain-containing putative transcriptional regulator [Streptosporangium sp. NPDC002721]|uniref:AfsR/SARP family transcriptional regulator n=1 Tax=Streptosporangium sp. NPDC002721 TaxID=3366188 RepID=UPI00367A24C8
MRGPVWFTVLGPVHGWREGEELDLGPPRQRALLAVLLAFAGCPAGLAEIVDILWGEDPPDSAVNVVQRHIGALRRLLEPDLPRRAVGRWLTRSGGGYRLDVDAGTLDLLRFRHLVDRAREAGPDGPRAGQLFVEALELWRRPAAEGIAAGVRAHPVFVALDQEYLAVLKEAADTVLRDGPVTPLVPMLQQAAALNPFDEPLHARLVLALAATGHRAEALGTYRATYARLAEKLGISPGPELSSAHERVLSQTAPEEPKTPSADSVTLSAPVTPVTPATPVAEATPSASVTPATPVAEATPSASVTPVTPAGAAAPAAAAASAAPVSPSAPVAVGPPRPAQLPADLPVFAGRREELARVSDLLLGGPRFAKSVAIIAIEGMAGIGKTTLAVHWAQRVAHLFPDGQLYVNLRGFDAGGTVLDPTEAIRGFLTALGVPSRDVPARLDDQTALYRSLLADRRMLVLLDNACGTEQVRPLLPGAPGCLVIVTGRHHLSGLVAAEGARSLILGLLSDAEAREFLALRLGAERVELDPAAVQEITDLCARLPLALSVAAARAASRPAFPLSVIAAELRAVHGSLDAFNCGDGPHVGAVFSWSYRALTPPAARLFRLVALHPGPGLSAPAAAALGAVPVHQARVLLDELTGAHLLVEHAPGRYGCHDLLRSYAAERSRDQETESQRQAAVRRLLDHYLHTAHRAALLFSPHRNPIPLTPPAPGVFPEELADREQAGAWFTAEHATLLAVLGSVAETEFRSYAWRLAWTMEHFMDRHGHWHDLVTSQRIALKTARRLGDPIGTAHAHRGLARAEADLGRHDEARLHLERALALFADAGDGDDQAHTHRQLGWVLEQQARYGGALVHARRALILFQKSGRRAGQAAALNAVGWYHALLGHHEQALGHCRQALVLLEELEDHYGQADTWDSLGYAHHHLGHYEQAISDYRRALELYRRLGVRYGEADTLTRLGATYLADGRHREARAVLEQALEIFDDLGHSDAERVRARLRDLDGSSGGSLGALSEGSSEGLSDGSPGRSRR